MRRTGVRSDAASCANAREDDHDWGYTSPATSPNTSPTTSSGQQTDAGAHKELPRFEADSAVRFFARHLGPEGAGAGEAMCFDDVHGTRPPPPSQGAPG
jgi:hypothetical protein